MCVYVICLHMCMCMYRCMHVYTCVGVYTYTCVCVFKLWSTIYIMGYKFNTSSFICDLNGML